MYDPLRDAWIKHNRALEHLQSLNEACESYVERDPRPYWVEVHYEALPSCHIASFRYTKPPEARLGAIVGDIVHNLRSALDVSAWQLALQNDADAAQGNPRRVAFPLTTSEEAFSGHGALGLFSERGREVLERLQPYECPDRDDLQALRWLNAMSNADKHRVTTTAFGAVDLATVRFRTNVPLKAVGLILYGDEIKAGAPIARIEVDGPPNTHVYVDGHPKVQILFGTDLGRIGRAGLAAMFKTVEYVLNELGVAY